MLPKNRRIPRGLFKSLLKSRKYINSEYFSLHLAPSKTARVAVAVSKKVSKKAVSRNKIRRHAYLVISGFISKLPDQLFLLVVKPSASKLKKVEFEKELSLLFKKV